MLESVDCTQALRLAKVALLCAVSSNEKTTNFRLTNIFERVARVRIQVKILATKLRRKVSIFRERFI